MNDSSASSEILALLGALAYYNDKGFEHASHSPERVESERALALADLRQKVRGMDSSMIPNAVLAAIESGDVATDFTGRHAAALRAHLDLSAADAIQL